MAHNIELHLGRAAAVMAFVSGAMRTRSIAEKS
jgi:hypothetical protein